MISEKTCGVCGLTLRQLREYIEEYPYETMPLKLGEPFSWRGVYAEVGFSLDTVEVSKQENLARINEAFIEEFRGYQGGIYEYTGKSYVNFECDESCYTNGAYFKNFISANKDNYAVKKIFRLDMDFDHEMKNKVKEYMFKSKDLLKEISYVLSKEQKKELNQHIDECLNILIDE